MKNQTKDAINIKPFARAGTGPGIGTANGTGTGTVHGFRAGQELVCVCVLIQNFEE